MKGKSIITAVLLVFVLASVIYLLIGETRSAGPPTVAVADTEQPDEEAGLPEVGPVEANASSISDNQPTDSDDRKVVAYYFHTTARCLTCRKIESLTQQAIEEAFADKIASEELVWKVVNVEEPGNEHFVDEYQLYTKHVVLVRVNGGRQVEWKDLKRVWELVRNDVAFIQYIQDEVRSYLET